MGAFDLVGNVHEWVANWVPRSTDCVRELFFDARFITRDFNCLAGASTLWGPGALIRGGGYGDGEFAGVFAVDGRVAPSDSVLIGFRAAR